MHSVFFPEPALTALRANLQKDSHALAQAQACLAAAREWTDRSDEELWSAMFGATITRSWMVWSNGHCPACKGDVPMYDWKADPLHVPWKVTCPHCAEQFPKNDFGAFHHSGLDVHGVFDPALADRTLLFNTEHPSPDDPLHMFGVDDGEGYFDGTNRWRFIGSFIVKAQWKHYIQAGIRTLALAYILSGEQVYAHKAVILLDRVADLYPTFNYLTQGLSYEIASPTTGAGLVSVWHDACRETRDMALAFDMIAPAIAADGELVEFLAQKATRHQLANPKDTPEKIRENIEAGILRHVIEHQEKILSNFPNTEVTLIVAHAILGWRDNRPQLLADLQTMLEKVTAVDGLSGEKGLGGYAAIAPRLVAGVLALFSRLAPDLLAEMVRRVPGLVAMFRFHADTWVAETHYPRIGDTGAFGRADPHYLGATFSRNPFDPEWTNLPFCSDFTLFQELYHLTGDPIFVQLLYRGNERQLEGLPHDLLATDAAGFQTKVAAVIREHGAALPVRSVNKEQWAVALLRTGAGTTERAVWLDYDVGGNHGRPDAMGIGLYAKGVELLPGFAYPAVHFGGWYSPRALWYKRTAAHNTVVVDGKDQTLLRNTPETEPLKIQLNPCKGLVRGTTTAWADGTQVKLIQATGPHLVQTTPLQRYERALLLVDISAEDSYVLDIFRVAGGCDHAKFMHGYFGTATATGLGAEPWPTDFGPEVQMRNFRGGAPDAGWLVDWQIDDRLKVLAAGSDIHLRYTDLTTGAQAALAESWIAYRDHEANHEAWLPSLVVRRQATEAPLSSTFVGVMEPYAGQSNLGEIRRLPLQTSSGQAAGDAHVAVVVTLADGRTDLLIAAAAGEARATLVQPDWSCTTDADFCVIRRNASGKIEYVLLHGGTHVQCGDRRVELPSGSAWVEM
ncbi:MAG: heparinase II/III-family protein [Cephaloticoccus sp.]|nr:heparinase II/III-family protein [Cephaloticoccus sp.]MCF7759705.1 heparinase II/III-family protein [Cephaloticoccus sp.]